VSSVLPAHVERAVRGLGSPTPADRSGSSALPSAPPGYELLRDLGAGGMGAVYLARNQITERTVAMKFLSPGSPLDRFLVEVRALAHLKHPNIVRVLTAEIDPPHPYFTMEYAAGGSLADRVKRSGPLDPADAARLMAAVARAIHAAHAAGVLHRDLKPSNILLANAECGVRNAESGEAGSGLDSEFRTPHSAIPVVADFGLAKRLDRDDDLTHGSGALGTPHFMPPEQAAGGCEPDVRSDVYGLGATLYYLLTGRPPLTGDTADVIVRLRAGEEPPLPRSVRPDLPADLEGVVVRCLERDPAKRYASAAELADDLDRFLAGEPPVAVPVTWRRRAWRAVVRQRRRIAAGTAVVLLVVGGFGFARLLGPGGGSNDATRRAAHLAAMRREADDIRRRLAAGEALKPDVEDGRPRYYVERLGAASFGKSSSNEAAYYCESLGLCLLELVPDPGIDRYRLTFEVRQDSPKAGAAGESGRRSALGPYFGHAESTAAGGRAVHTLFALPYSDTLPNPEPGDPPTMHAVRFRSVVLASNADTTPSVHYNQIRSLRFEPSPNPVGLWRAFEITVTPDQVAVRWKADGKEFAPVHELTRDVARQEYADLGPRLDQHHPGTGARVPDWSPRMPAGIWLSRAGVSVRSIEITPLP
jgi:hypothetical protein